MPLYSRKRHSRLRETIAWIVFEPKKLPALAKTIGKEMTKFKRTTEEVKFADA
jgi:Sec-independent protein translocase protein TatA